MKINCASSIFPCTTFDYAINRIREGVDDPLWGRLSSEVIQLCPQNIGLLNESAVISMIENNPGTEFMFHASPKIFDAPHGAWDASNCKDAFPWFKRMKDIYDVSGMSHYSIHAGRRSNATLSEMLDNVRMISDFMGFQIAVEGLYPDAKGLQLISSWAEYETVMNSGVKYVIDLSHLNILCTHFGREDDLTKSLISHPNCEEIHLSLNDGKADSHASDGEKPWWTELLVFAAPQTRAFSEGQIKDVVNAGD